MITVGKVYFRNNLERIFKAYIMIIIDIHGTMVTYRRLDDQRTHVTTAIYIADIPKYFDEVL